MKVLASLGILFFITASALASISYTPSSPKVGETVTFTVTPPSGDIVGSITWDFGDGTTRTLPPPDAEHTYSGPGTYSVRATYRYQVAGAPEIEQTDTTSITVTAAPTPSISYSPSHPTAGEVVTFTANNFSSTTCIKWNFGDGTTVNDTSPPLITYMYLSPGSYTIKAYDNCGAEVTATTSVSVGGAERSISYTPPHPRVNEEVTFKANKFFSNQIKWDFGDGTIIPQGTGTALHTYENPGTYTVKAWDYYGQQQVQTTQQTLPPVTTQITVGPDIRAISYSPTPALANQEITFTAKNFRSSCIRWDFGDGTVLAKGSPVETHIYKKEGSYTVTAYDRCGEDKFPRSMTLRVLPRRGPAAPFSISFIQLRFRDGKAYKQVPKDFTPLVAFADIKSEGTGILQAQWLVDGKPLSVISKSLRFAEKKTISSGKFPPLPTQVPGIHEVSLSIIHPQVDYKIPTVRYFVSLEEVEKRVALSVSQVKDLGGKIITVKENHLSLTLGKHYLFSGTIQNLSGEEIPSALLQVSLADKVVDRQMIKNLKPLEQRDFETSILNDSTQEKKLSLRVFDTSLKGKLLGMRELRIVRALPQPELMREIAQKEKLIPLGGEGPEYANLEICDFEILQGPGRGERTWRSISTYEYNGGGEHDNIKFRIRVINRGPTDFSGSIAITAYSYSTRARAFYTTPYLVLAPDETSEYFEVILNQSEWIERRELSIGRYRFRTKISLPPASPEAPLPEPIYSSNHVTLSLRSHPVGEAIPIITLMSEESLTGSVSNKGDTGGHLQVGNWSWTGVARVFITFDLSEIRRELLRMGRYWSWDELEIRSATLEIEEFAILSFVPGTYEPPWHWLTDWCTLETRGELVTPTHCDEGIPSFRHEEVGDILLDYLIGYDEFSSDIYDVPMVTNLRTFQSACGVHSFRHMEAYVRYQLERGERKIQFRLRFADEELEGEPEWTLIYSVLFRNPRLVVTVVPK
jgi:PKD repeat protein